MKYFIKLFFLIYLILQATYAFATPLVVDGDSLIDDKTRIRLDDIDAPEIFQTCYRDDEEYACGQEAYIYLQNLIQNNLVKCDCLEQKDKYGRLLCECFVGNLSLNKEMVKAGWAVAYRSEKYMAEQEEAMANNSGLWQGKFMRPALFRILEHLKQQEIKN